MSDVKINMLRTLNPGKDSPRSVYELASKHAGRPMKIRFYSDGRISVTGRATNHQLAELIRVIIQEET